MLPTGTSIDWASVEIAVPRAIRPPPGISMAGFCQRVPAVVDLAMVAHPDVTLLIDLSRGNALGYDVGGRREYGSVVVGLHPGEFRATGQGTGECLQIRREPVTAAAVFGAPAEVGGAVARDRRRRVAGRRTGPARCEGRQVPHRPSLTGMRV
ncbi:hypothetical protein ACN27G_15775 [Plantactinospora sp. WMMB334]|uniref:hypothetical protein n=1 Tax=Plantactinospora sp. WMMB334 TaxID=3404119 RepID=UPI003B948CB1